MVVLGVEHQLWDLNVGIASGNNNARIRDTIERLNEWPRDDKRRLSCDAIL